MGYAARAIDHGATVRTRREATRLRLRLYQQMPWRRMDVPRARQRATGQHMLPKHFTPRV